MRTVTLLAAVTGLALAGCQSAESEDGGELYEAYPPGAPQDCISVRLVDRVDPVGDHTLLFYTRGGQTEVWRNRLDRPCAGLRPDTVLMYEPRSGRLCDTDIVWQLERLGFGLRRAGACTLGEFDALTEEQAEAVKEFR
jgi:hypothetical protein